MMMMMMMMTSISLFGPVGCGRPLRGQRDVSTSSTLARHRGFLAIHFVKVVMMMTISPVLTTSWAVGALFSGAKCIHIDCVCVHISRSR